jgi:hypothetical protein
MRCVDLNQQNVWELGAGREGMLVACRSAVAAASTAALPPLQLAAGVPPFATPPACCVSLLQSRLLLRLTAVESPEPVACYASGAYLSGAIHRAYFGAGLEGPLPHNTTIFYRVGDPDRSWSKGGCQAGQRWLAGWLAGRDKGCWLCDHTVAGWLAIRELLAGAAEWP